MISLTGKNKHNFLNLTGIQNSSINMEPIYIKNIKKRCFNYFIIPLQTNNWNIIDQNMFIYDDIYNKLNKYYKIKPSSDMQMYITILNVIFQLNGEYKNYDYNNQTKFDGLAKIIQTLPTIKLLPELELYNMILGKPENLDYDKEIIMKIKKLLKIENITYDKIKEYIS